MPTHKTLGLDISEGKKYWLQHISDLQAVQMLRDKKN